MTDAVYEIKRVLTPPMAVYERKILAHPRGPGKQQVGGHIRHSGHLRKTSGGTLRIVLGASVLALFFFVFEDLVILGCRAQVLASLAPPRQVIVSVLRGPCRILANACPARVHWKWCGASGGVGQPTKARE